MLRQRLYCSFSMCSTGSTPWFTAVRWRHGQRPPSPPASVRVPGGLHRPGESEASAKEAPAARGNLRSGFVAAQQAGVPRTGETLVSGPRRHATPASAVPIATPSSSRVAREEWTLNDKMSSQFSVAGAPISGTTLHGGSKMAGRTHNSKSQRLMPINPQVMLKKEAPTPSRKKDPLKGLPRERRIAAKDPRLINVPEETMKRMVDFELQKEDKKGIRWGFYRLNWRLIRNLNFANVYKWQSRFIVLGTVLMIIFFGGLYIAWYNIMWEFSRLPADYRRDYRELFITNGCRFGDAVEMAKKHYKEQEKDCDEMRDFLMMMMDHFRKDGTLETNWFRENHSRHWPIFEGDYITFMTWMILYLGCFVTWSSEPLSSTVIPVAKYDVVGSQKQRGKKQSNFSDASIGEDED